MPVYAIRCGERGPIKLGVAGNPQGRLIELQVAHFETLVLLRAWEGGEAEEAELHRQFFHARIRGEWHQLRENELDAITLPLVWKPEPPVEPVKAEPVKPEPIKIDLPPPVDVAGIVESRRLELGLSRLAVARRAGLNETYVRDLVVGRSTNQKTIHLRALAAALELSPEVLTNPTFPAPSGEVA